VLTGLAVVTPDEFGSSGRLTCGKRDRNSGTSTAHSSGMASVTYDLDNDGGGVGGGTASAFRLGVVGTVNRAAVAGLFLATAVASGSPRAGYPLPLPVALPPAIASETYLACSCTWFAEDCQSVHCCS